MSATWKDIADANATIRTTAIEHKDKQGNTISKDYAEVNQRVKAFRMVYPHGRISTEMLSNENGVCVFKATVYCGEQILAEGTAYEKESSSFINKTSYIENCETSAVGRALGFAGFGIDTSIASAEEVQNALKNQEPPAAPAVVDERKATEKQIEILSKTYKGANLEKLLKANELEKLEDMTLKKASELIAALAKRKEKKDV